MPHATIDQRPHGPALPPATARRGAHAPGRTARPRAARPLAAAIAAAAACLLLAGGCATNRSKPSLRNASAASDDGARTAADVGPGGALANATAMQLLDGWVGRWAGSGRVAAPDRIERSFDWTLVVSPVAGDPNRLRLAHEFSEGTRLEARGCELILVDPTQRRFRMLEDNGVEIEMAYVASGLYFEFEIGDRIVGGRYRFEGDVIDVEMVTFLQGLRRISGGDGDIPEVTSRAPITVQRARLERQGAPRSGTTASTP